MRTVGVLAAAATLLLAGCGDSDSGDSGDGGPPKGESAEILKDKDFVDETGSDSVVVDAVDNNFRDDYIEVSKGSTVEFVNEGRNVHNVIPVTEDEFPEIAADDFEPDDTGEVTFDEVGDFAYYCSLHGTKTKGMVGGIRVVE